MLPADVVKELERPLLFVSGALILRSMMAGRIRSTWSPPRMLVTLFVALAGFTLVFLGLFWLRYSVELAERAFNRRPKEVAA